MPPAASDPLRGSSKWRRSFPASPPGGPLDRAQMAPKKNPRRRAPERQNRCRRPIRGRRDMSLKPSRYETLKLREGERTNPETMMQPRWWNVGNVAGMMQHTL
eukprot:4605650-Pyramimonas_sp.AAC.1